MMLEITKLTFFKILGYATFLQMLILPTCAVDITLSKPSTTLQAQIGEVYHITCPAYKCQKPEFIWSSLMDQTLSGTVNTTGQISILTMRISSESDGSYRCTVSCDKPPAEKVFKVIPYSFPAEPVLNISSLIPGKQSRITCTVPDIYPSEMFSAKMYLGELIVAEYEEAEMDVRDPKVKNISISYDLILTEKHEAQEIRCLAELTFLDDTIDAIEKHATKKLELLYPPEEVIIEVDPSLIVRADTEVSLYCYFKCRSPAQLQWVKDEEPVTLTNKGVIRMSHVKPEDSGVYICYVQNDAGRISSQIQITVEAVPQMPILNIYPTTTAHIGQTVTIECVAAGDEDVNVTLWKVLKHGDVPLLEKAGSYIIKEASPMDAATYKCTAENLYGFSEASESFTVEYPPVDTLLSASAVEVNEGDSVTLSCSSKGVPEPSFSLYHLLPSGESILLSEGPVFTLTNLTSGVYQCEAGNSLGIKKDKLQLSVRFKPRNTFLTITPSSMMKEGDLVSIKCTSEAYPAPILVLKKRTEMGLIKLEAEHGQYNIKHVALEHQGEYICESSNVVGQQVAEATLTVQVPPKDTRITISPSSVLREGESVLIMCTSEAFPAPNLALKVRREHGVQELASMGGQYQIAHVGVRHSGTYICESTNMAGEQIVETTMTIQVPPKNTVITTTPSPVMREGESGYIKCTSEGNPAPTLMLKKKTETEIIELEHESGQYNIQHAGTEHAGEYICESTNEAGQQMASTILTVQAPPRNTHIFITPFSLVTEGDEVQIQCISEAFPTPKLVLKRKTELGRTELLDSENGLYNITNAGLWHIGTYICESTNGAGEQTAEARLNVQIPSRTTTVVTPSQNITSTVPSINATHHIIPPPERQQSTRFDYVPPAIIGSVILLSACAIGIMAHHFKQAKVQGSYSLVKALRSKV